MNWFFTLFKTNFYQPVDQLTTFTFLTRQQSSKSHSIRASVKQLTNQTKLSLIHFKYYLITVPAEVQPTWSELANIMVCSSVPKSKMNMNSRTYTVHEYSVLSELACQTIPIIMRISLLIKKSSQISQFLNNTVYYSFNIFLPLIDKNSKHNIHHNQLLLTKFGRNLLYVKNDVNSTA